MNRFAVNIEEMVASIIDFVFRRRLFHIHNYENIKLYGLIKQNNYNMDHLLLTLT